MQDKSFIVLSQFSTVKRSQEALFSCLIDGGSNFHVLNIPVAGSDRNFRQKLILILPYARA